MESTTTSLEPTCCLRPGTMIRQAHGLEMLGNIGYTGKLPELVKDENGKPAYRGQDIISLIIPDNIHLRFRSRSNDMVMVKNGQVDGTLDKRAIGVEDGRLLDAIVQTNGSEQGARFLDGYSPVHRCLYIARFTTVLTTKNLSTEAIAAINSANESAQEEVNQALERFGKDGKKYESRPGRTPRETLEEDIMQLLDKGATSGDIAKDELNKSRFQPTLRSTWPFPVPVVPWTT